MKILELRKDVDVIDDKLIRLLNERYLITDQIGEYKRKNGLRIENMQREKEIFLKVNEVADSKNIKDILDIYSKIIEFSKERQISE